MPRFLAIRRCEMQFFSAAAQNLCSSAVRGQRRTRSSASKPALKRYGICLILIPRDLPPAQAGPIIVPIIANRQHDPFKALHARDFLFRRSAGRGLRRDLRAGLGFGAHAADAGSQRHCLRTTTAAASARGCAGDAAVCTSATLTNWSGACAANGCCARHTAAGANARAGRATGCRRTQSEMRCRRMCGGLSLVPRIRLHL